ncbi:MAG TPA: FhaA domain-containing protein [Candidatus Caenarcaniphilales bacterium]|nr:FhaA domain-containing protein [Candidatus Caenarcaniphilales bacterium]
MAGPLAAVERFFERLLERPAARLFQARLEPVHLQRHLERAMEDERHVEGQRTYVPSRYRVRLNRSDLEALERYGTTLSADLAEALHAHARRRRYLLRARPAVEFHGSHEVAAGDVVIQTEAFGPPLAPPAGPAGERFPSIDRLLPMPTPPSAPAPAAPPVEERRTAVYATPTPMLPKAVIAVHMPGRPVTRLPLRNSTIRIGRALDNDIVLPDERVSRHHGQISVRLGTLVYADLGSTNGSFLNGSAVTEIALGPTDVLQVGGSSLTIESGS